MNSNFRLCFVFAHPDDESFMVAGTACHYGARGACLSLVAATLGQQGKRGNPTICEQCDLPEVRRQELHEAAHILGIQHVHVLDYQDRHLAEADPEQIRRDLVRVLRLRRPQVVVTFDPNGANLHPDHIAISRFASDAIVAAADPRWMPEEGPAHQVQRLLWPSLTLVSDLAKAGELAALPGNDFVLDVHPWWERKRDALRAHKSQHISIDRVFFSQQEIERVLSVEAFRQAWGPPLPVRPGQDLFAGVSVEGTA